MIFYRNCTTLYGHAMSRRNRREALLEAQLDR